MILFFDTETTGVPKNYKAAISDLDNWPRIIQLAWAAFDDDGNLLESQCDLIRPDGWVIPTEKFWIDNGYNTEKSIAEGIPMIEALIPFINAINASHTMVAHNMQFDFPIVCAEMNRAGIRAMNKPEKRCTMMLTTNLCQIPGARGYKWPKLEELHHFLFKEGFDGAHDALNDVKACARCYFELKKRNLHNPVVKEKAPVIDTPPVSEL